MNASNGNDDGRRLTDLEAIVRSLLESQRHLLTAQVILNDRQGTVEQSIKELVEAQKRTDAQISALTARQETLTAGQEGLNERVDKLVIAIGRLIERLPPPANATN
jgi:hypothetical protein